MKNVKNKLRVVHFPQVGYTKSFKVEVKDEEMAYFIMMTLAYQHIWLERNHIIPDYSNVIIVEMYDESIDEETGKPYGWSTYYNDEEMMEWAELEETYFLPLLQFHNNTIELKS
jgi:hypothetical protein